MPAPEADRILEVNTARIRAAGENSINELRKEIENCRVRGFALRGPTEAPEILSLAITVCNSYGTPVLALSISALAFRIEQRRDQLLTMLHGAGRTLEKRLSAQSYR
jgi:DNA-binding IclR family transcriptional regulator